ncbi:universal stress protein [Pseudolysinimonas yzui]|nr:universal stress protein [Pseudolysinimonas yzui]
MNASKETSAMPVTSEGRIGERIVVVEDDGPAGRAAVRWVGARVGRHPAEVHVVCPLPRADDQAAVSAHQDAVDRGTQVVHTVAPNAHVSAEVLIGDPEETLAEQARGADLLVIGATDTPLRRDALPLRLASSAECVVVVVPAEWAPSGGRTVVGASIDTASDAAIDFASAHARRGSGHLHVVHVWDLPVTGELPPPMNGDTGSIPDLQRHAIETFTAELSAGSAGLEVTSAVDRGEPADILRAAAEGADLLVVGRRRRGSLTRLLLGSVSHALVQDPPCPVAVVPQPSDPIDVHGDGGGTAATY